MENQENLSAQNAPDNQNLKNTQEVAMDNNAKNTEEERKKALSRISTIQTGVIFSALVIVTIVLLLAFDPRLGGVVALVFGPLILLAFPVALAFSWKLFSEQRRFRKEFGKLPCNTIYIISDVCAVVCALPIAIYIAMFVMAFV